MALHNVIARRIGRRWRKRGNRARDINNFRAAAVAYRTYLKFAPDDSAIWIQLGHMLTEARDLTGADVAYSRADDLKPNDSDLLLCWGHSRKIAGDTHRARELYTLSAALNGNPDALRELVALPIPLRPPALKHTPGRVTDPHRRPAETSEAPEDRPAWTARIACIKPFAGAASELALLVTHSSNGMIKPSILPYVRALSAEGIAVLLIVAAERPVHIEPELLDSIAGAYLRENDGFDFAAWSHVLHLEPDAYASSILYLVNDSVIGPAGNGRFMRVIRRVRGSNADLVGLTQSLEYGWHVQSYFLAAKQRLLASDAFQDFWGGVRRLSSKDAVIQNYEILLSQRIRAAGFPIEVLFPTIRAGNPTLYEWRALIEAGFPFVKTLLARGEFAEADISGLRTLLDSTGFDMDVLDATVDATLNAVPRRLDDRLTYDPPRSLPPNVAALKLAYHGPWNVAGPVGDVARAMVAALRRSGCRLSLEPVIAPFRRETLVSPAINVCDFAGPADVAIIDILPSDWPSLSPVQVERIQTASRRIGRYGNIDKTVSIDRIWFPVQTPSASSGIPVDFVPPPVPLPAERIYDRSNLLHGFSLPTGGKIVSVIASPSEHQGTMAITTIIHAFSTSSLPASGWHLLILAPEANLTEADKIHSIDVIRDRLSPEDQARFWALSDVHISTGDHDVEEAMSHGRLILAAEPTSSCPLLSNDCAILIPLDDCGEVAFPVFTELLEKAAALPAADGRRLADHAREKIATERSIDRISDLITQSLGHLLAQQPMEAATPPLVTDPRTQGIPMIDARFGSDLVPLMLATDGTPTSSGMERFPELLGDSRWALIAPEGSFLAPNLKARLAHYAAVRPDIAVFYADDVCGNALEALDQLRVKPEFDITLLSAMDYVGCPIFIRADALRRLAGLHVERRTAATADLLFRAKTLCLGIARIPEVLLAFPGERPRPTLADYQAMLENNLRLTDYIVRPGHRADTLAIARHWPSGTEPHTTILIPTCRTRIRDQPITYIERLLNIVADTQWPMDRLTVIVGDDGIDEPAWANAEWPFRLRRLSTPRPIGEPFNYATKMNLLWQAADTEQLIFLNDDVAPLGADWLSALQTFASDLTVGGVGARLLYPDGSLQHAGIAPHGSGAGHCWIRRFPSDTYQNWALVHREWSMVTGAVFATRRSVMDLVGGFDEKFALEFNDTDLCLRLRSLGYRIVYTPHAEFEHAERASRGDRLPPAESKARFRSRWRDWLAADPSWHPQLRRDRIDVTPAIPAEAWYLPSPR